MRKYHRIRRLPPTEGCRLERKENSMRLLPLATLLLILLPERLPAGEESQIAIQLPLERVAYQTNEAIELAVVRNGPALPAGTLNLKATSDEGGKLEFSFPIAKGEGRA